MEVSSDIDGIEVFLDAKVLCEPGLPPQGKKPIALPVSDGTVDLGVLEPFGGTKLVASLLALCSRRAEVGLGDLVMAAFDGGVRWAWLLKQLVWCIGSALEVRLLALAEQMAALDGGALSTKQRRDATKALGNFARTVSMKERLEKNARKEVANYWLASRQAFHNEVAMSLAVDATRAGGRGLFVGFCCTPGNKAVWLPPQAPRVRTATYTTNWKLRSRTFPWLHRFQSSYPTDSPPALHTFVYTGRRIFYKTGGRIVRHIFRTGGSKLRACVPVSRFFR